MLNSGRVDRRRAYTILLAAQAAFSRELLGETWYDALALTEEQGREQRQMDQFNQAIEQKMQATMRGELGR
mgnify:CR=1 FL=1